MLIELGKRDQREVFKLSMEAFIRILDESKQAEDLV